MSGSEAPRPSANAWVPWIAALVGFGFQVIWFSTQFGSLSARIEDAERRVALIEQNGSPVVQGIRTEVTINGRRISTLEDLYNSKVSNALIASATHEERLGHIQSDIDSLLQWRIARGRGDGDVDGRLAALERQLQQLQAEHRTLEQHVIANLHTSQRP